MKTTKKARKSELTGGRGTEYRLSITCPSGAGRVNYRCHIAVEGTVTPETLPEDAILTVSLLDRAGKTLRYARCEKKGSGSIFIPPDLVRYPAGIDDDLSGMRAFGFPILAVADAERPTESYHNATVKCWYGDGKFKAVLATATDPAHGLALPDGMELTDGEGKPYDVLPEGDYTLTAVLCDRAGTLLGRAEKPISIGDPIDQVICRFNPPEHRARMTAWCGELGVTIQNDPLPGYLDPYAGRWFYHMGLLKMYRACDVTMYARPRVHLFVYQMTEDSTSVSTELGYLQTHGRLSSRADFTAYCYDIGEASVRGLSGRAVEFPEGEYLRLCRLDLVNDTARENEYRLDASGVEQTIPLPGWEAAPTKKVPVEVPAGAPFALMGVLRPWQQDPSDFRLLSDNTYEARNRPSVLHYEFTCGNDVLRFERPLRLERVDGSGSLGVSIMEFYHLFRLPASWSGSLVRVSASAGIAKAEVLLTLK